MITNMIILSPSEFGGFFQAKVQLLENLPLIVHKLCVLRTNCFSVFHWVFHMGYNVKLLTFCILGYCLHVVKSLKKKLGIFLVSLQRICNFRCKLKHGYGIHNFLNIWHSSVCSTYIRKGEKLQWNQKREKLFLEMGHWSAWLWITGIGLFGFYLQDQIYSLL